jgi:hypothetical protein
VVLLVGAALAGCAGPQASVPPHLPDFQKLAGMSAADLERQLGEPDFRRSEPPAEVWQYRGESCVLDLFLYRDGTQYRVVYAETRDRDTIRVAEANCYSSLFTHPGHEARNQG